MRFYLLSDNVDTLVGMRLVGIEGVVIHEKEKLFNELSLVLDNDSIAIVLITTKLVEMIPEVISELKLRSTQPMIVEIPDRHGDNKTGSAIDRYVSKAIGVKI